MDRRGFLARIGQSWCAQPLVRQFLILSSAIFLLGMVATAAFMSRRIEHSVTEHTAAATALYFESVIAPLVQSLGAQDELPPDKQAELGRLISDTALGRRVVSFKIWRNGGVIAYASDRELVGKRFTPSHNLREAWTGKVAAEFDALDEEESKGERAQGMPLLEIYAPIRELGSERIIAVAEFYERAEQLQRDLAEAKLEGWLIIGVIALGAVAALFGVVGRAGRTIERQITELRALLARNQELQARVERSSQRVSEVNERHLRRLGGDLHDGPAQLIGLALLRLDAVANSYARHGKANADVTDDLETIRKSLRDSLDEIRNISVGLVLPELEQLSLRETLQAAIRDHVRRTNSAVDADVTSIEGDAPHPVKTAAFRFMQEALNNAARHANGSGHSVVARRDEGILTIEVRDRGPGFEPGAPRTEHQLGLTGMRERVESIGGDLSIDSNPGRGTCVTARLPYVPAVPSHA